jgi:hypothetical protein
VRAVKGPALNFFEQPVAADSFRHGSGGGSHRH